MREIVHLQAGQCGNQIGAKVKNLWSLTAVSLKRWMQWLNYDPVSCFLVLGSDFGRARNWSYRHVPRRFRPSVGKNQRLLQWSHRYNFLAQLIIFCLIWVAHQRNTQLKWIVHLSLFYSSRWKICSPCCLSRSWTRYNGLCTIRSVWTNLQAR